MLSIERAFHYLLFYFSDYSLIALSAGSMQKLIDVTEDAIDAVQKRDDMLAQLLEHQVTQDTDDAGVPLHQESTCEAGQ
jgi:hypothetical protein